MIPEAKKKEYLQLAEKLFASPALNKALFEAIPYTAMIVHQDRVLLAANQAAIGIGVVPGTNCWDTFGKLASIPQEDRDHFEKHGKAPDGGTKCHFCEADHALASGKPVVKEVKLGDTVWETYWVPVGEKVYLHYAIDVTLKKAEG
ncbi:MAG: hypothetical protein HQK86_15280 [Nitrospinae bacterium]|nr:hypothetical protein [Nitrospinota bacterium]